MIAIMRNMSDERAKRKQKAAHGKKMNGEIEKNTASTEYASASEQFGYPWRVRR